MRKFVGMALTYNIEVEEVELEQDPGPDFIPLTNLRFKWQMGWNGCVVTVTPEVLSDGRYQVTITPIESGTLFWRWEGDANVIFKSVKEGFDRILPSAFETRRRAYA